MTGGEGGREGEGKRVKGGKGGEILTMILAGDDITSMPVIFLPLNKFSMFLR